MGTRKVTVNLPEEQIAFLKRLAEQEHISFTDALRRSINAEKFFIEQAQSGRKILVEEKDHKLREIVRQ